MALAPVPKKPRFFRTGSGRTEVSEVSNVQEVMAQRDVNKLWRSGGAIALASEDESNSMPIQKKIARYLGSGLID